MRRLILFLIACPSLAGATAYTSVATGNWSSTTTWTPAGVPGTGDTVTLANGFTVTIQPSVAITVGSSPSTDTGTPAIQCSAYNGTGILVVSAGAQLTFQGPVRQCLATWTISAGATITHDSSQCSANGCSGPSSTNYTWQIGYGSNYTGNPTTPVLAVNGTAANPVLFNIASGSGNAGGFYASGIQDSGAMQAGWLQMTNWGTATQAAWYIYSYTSAATHGLTASCNYCTFTNSGEVNLAESVSGTSFIFNNNTIVSPLNATYGIEVTVFNNSITPFTCQIENNYIEGELHEVFGQGASSGTDSHCIVNGNVLTGTATLKPYAGTGVGHANGNFDGNLLYDQPSGSSASMGAISVTRTVFLWASPSSSQHLYGMSSNYTTTFDGGVWEREYTMGANDSTSSFIYPMSATAYQYNITLQHYISIPSPSNIAPSDTTNNACSGNGTSTFCPVVTGVHNTLLPPLTGTNFSAYYFEQVNGLAGFYGQLTDNLFWLPTAGTAWGTGCTQCTPVAGVYANVNNNAWANVTGSAYTSKYQGNAAWYNPAPPGQADINITNPNFVGCTYNGTSSISNCNFSTWAKTLGITVNSWADIIAQFKCMNAPSGCTMSNSSILAYYNWVRAGFVPTNPALHNAASDGTDIGAMPWTAPPSFTMTTSMAGTGTGTITGCGGTYLFGQSYSCTVTPGASVTISSVTGCGGSGTTTYTGTMPNGNCTVTATFTQSYNLTTSVIGSGTVSGCAGSYALGQTFTCTVTPSPSWSIYSVTGCGGTGTSTYTGTMPSQDCTVAASFTQNVTTRQPSSKWTIGITGTVIQ